MDKRVMKYNPAFLSKDELVDAFVVRCAELGLVVQILRENTGPSNQHVLVIGPRGAGKTMLVLRVAEQIRRDEHLASRWYPLVFSEESYQVTTAGEFWLEAIFHLGQKTGEMRWKVAHEELQEETDEARLRERSLAQLLDFADTEKKKLLLIVENLNMLLGEQMADEHGWALRHTLLREPRIMLLATATSRFEQIDNVDKPMFDLFRTIELEPLGEADCRTMWVSISGGELADNRVRPIQILTGGNPRLLAIIGSFAARMSFRELMADLMQLVDDHTEYFKSHIDSLAAVERKVYLALAELWAPVSTREVAEAARLDVNKASSLLGRLVERGMVAELNGSGRKKLYQVAERMYNVYYLMRRRGAPSRRIKAVVNFMAGFYGTDELLDAAQRIAKEACVLEPKSRSDHYVAYEELMRRLPGKRLTAKLIDLTPHQFLVSSDAPESLRTLTRDARRRSQAKVLLKRAAGIVAKSGVIQDAEEIVKKLMEIAPGEANAWAELGFLLEEQEHCSEAEASYRRAAELDPHCLLALRRLGWVLQSEFKQYAEAEQVLRKAIELNPDNAWTWAALGVGLWWADRPFDQAESALRKALELDPTLHQAWEGLGRVLHMGARRLEDAEDAYRKAIALNHHCHVVWNYLGDLLQDCQGREMEAEQAYRKSINQKRSFVAPRVGLARLLNRKLARHDEAERVCREIINLDDSEPSAWAELASILHENAQRSVDAEEAYRKVTELDPSSGWAWRRLGQLLYERGEDHKAAEVAMRKAVELEPDDGHAWALLGRILLDSEQPAKAEEACRKGISLEPTAPCAWIYLGMSLVRMGHYGEAEQALRNGVKIKEDCYVAWAELGRLLEEHLGEYEEARRAYATASSLSPDSDGDKVQLAILSAERLHRGEEALKLLGDLARRSGISRSGIELVTRLSVALCATGRAREAHKVLSESPNMESFEPLVIGLRLYLGEDVKAATEIMEVAKDVVKRIEKRHEKLDSLHAAQERGKNA